MLICSFDLLDFWCFKCLHLRFFEMLFFWLLGCFEFLLLRILDFWIFEFLIFWLFAFLNLRLHASFLWAEAVRSVFKEKLVFGFAAFGPVNCYKQFVCAWAQWPFPFSPYLYIHICIYILYMCLCVYVYTYAETFEEHQQLIRKIFDNIFRMASIMYSEGFEQCARAIIRAERLRKYIQNLNSARTKGRKQQHHPSL